VQTNKRLSGQRIASSLVLIVSILTVVPTLPRANPDKKSEVGKRKPGENDMRTWTLRLGLILLALAGVRANRLSGQDVVPPAQPNSSPPAVAYEPAHPPPLWPTAMPTAGFGDPGPAPVNAPEVDFKESAPDVSFRYWARSEYLLWWVKNAPLPIPIVTTGDPNVGFPALSTAGGIGQPGTQVLLGDSSQNFGTFSGMRITLGGWIDQEQIFGIEANGFLLERRPSEFVANSDASGYPPLYLPRFNPTAGIEDAVPIADPLRGFAGGVVVTQTLQLWGMEANGLLSLWRQGDMEIMLLGGFRYADLRETLQIHNATTDLFTGDVTTLNDFFGTRNQFYGGQIGAQFGFQYESWSIDFNTKIAMGSTHQVVDIQGNITQTGPTPMVPPGAGTFPGGFFAQPSNIGHYTADQFTVIPSVNLNVSYQITKRWRAFFGYEFMYWNQVVRPGDQMNHSVNLTQNAVLDPNASGGHLIGAAQPAPLFNRTDFWAHGVNFGMEFRF
jgi:hypothetical protein